MNGAIGAAWNRIIFRQLGAQRPGQVSVSQHWASLVLQCLPVATWIKGLLHTVSCDPASPCTGLRLLGALQKNMHHTQFHRQRAPHGHQIAEPLAALSLVFGDVFFLFLCFFIFCFG